MTDNLADQRIKTRRQWQKIQDDIAFLNVIDGSMYQVKDILERLTVTLEELQQHVSQLQTEKEDDKWTEEPL